MNLCLFASDLHGSASRYDKLFALAAREAPLALFLGGDLLPSIETFASAEDRGQGFLADVLAPHLEALRASGGATRVFAIPGNDDPRSVEPSFLALESQGLLSYLHGRRASLGRFAVYGYGCVPPTPFLLKDWERYDVSRFVDPGCVSPEEGRRSVPVPAADVKWGTIAADIAALTADDDLSNAVMLFHSPPYGSALDRAALDGRTDDHAPLDVHVGSIAIRRFIEERQPLVTLHGHIHESARLTGRFLETIGRTVALSAAHDGEELALVRFDLEDPGGATRELL